MLPGLFTLVIALVFILPLVMVAYQAGREVHGVFEMIDKARTDGIPPPDFLAHLPVGSQQATNWWHDNLASPDSASALLQRARQSQFVSNGRELGAEVAHRIVLFAFTLMTLFFLFREGDNVTGQMLAASARAFGPAGERVGRQIVASVHGTVDGLVLVGLGEGVVLGIGYVIAGVPHPTLFGLFTAIAAMVPFGAAVAIGDRHRRTGHGGDLRRRPFHPPEPDRQHHPPAVPLGPAWHPRRRRNLGIARPVPRPGDHGGADPALAGVDGRAIGSGRTIAARPAGRSVSGCHCRAADRSPRHCVQARMQCPVRDHHRRVDLVPEYYRRERSAAK
jgi:hypothetical protein